MSDGYRRQRVIYQDISGSLQILLQSGTIILQAPPGNAANQANMTIFIQSLYAVVAAPVAGGTWTFVDAVVPTIVLAIVPTDSATDKGNANGPTISTGFNFDLGPKGIPLQQGSSLALNISVGASAGYVAWEGYAKLTGVAGDHTFSYPNNG